MKPNEIRLGNWLFDYKGAICKAKPDTIDFLWKAWTGEFKGDVLPPTPIPLTPEWLEKAGFKTTSDRDGILEACIGVNPITQDYMMVLVNTGHHWFYRNAHFKIHFVHHLQNLYFALTGEELQFKD